MHATNYMRITPYIASIYMWVTWGSYEHNGPNLIFCSRLLGCSFYIRCTAVNIFCSVAYLTRVLSSFMEIHISCSDSFFMLGKRLGCLGTFLICNRVKQVMRFAWYNYISTGTELYTCMYNDVL